ncbi:MAG: cell division protein FtsZ, partial [Patescibacteria group bacterium]
KRIAEEAWFQLRDRVDALVTIHNDRLLGVINKETPLLNAFLICDDVLRQAVQGISDLIITPGIINVDFADVKAIMADAGTALMGVGYGAGEDRAITAAKAAVNSPLLDVSIDGARGVLFNVSGGTDLTMWEINEAARVITGSIDPTAKVIFGAVHDDRLKKGEIKITVIATGFTEARAAKVAEADEATQAVKRFAPEGARSSQEVREPESEWDAVPAFLRRKLK